MGAKGGEGNYSPRFWQEYKQYWLLQNALDYYLTHPPQTPTPGFLDLPTALYLMQTTRAGSIGIFDRVS